MNTPPDDLTQKKCVPCKGLTSPMSLEAARAFLPRVSGWSLEGQEIQKNFVFKNYYETVSFVNAVAWIAHEEDHHPDIQFSYKTCLIRYSTHAIKGLSENDFICAAKINQLLLRT